MHLPDFVLRFPNLLLKVAGSVPRVISRGRVKLHKRALSYWRDYIVLVILSAFEIRLQEHFFAEQDGAAAEPETEPAQEPPLALRKVQLQRHQAGKQQPGRHQGYA